MHTNVDGLSIEELRDSRASWWSGEFDDFLSSAFADVLPARILDAGCGVGTFEEHFASRCPSGTILVGLDIDLPRLQVALRDAGSTCPGVSVSYVAADGGALPFRDGTFRVASVILTLQHLSDPVRFLAEMRRVTEPGGMVVAVEADNLGQRLYLPHPSPDVDAALAAYWRRIRECCRPADIAIGPRLPDLFRAVGLPSPRVKAHVLANTSWVEPRVFAERTREAFRRIARKHGVDRSAECEALTDAIDRAAGRPQAAFYTISTVPLFLVTARV